jgi:hypothetical protein
MLLVASKAGSGTPARVVHKNMRGPWRVTESPYKTRVPAYNAWFPAERTLVRMTVFRKEAAAAICRRGKYCTQSGQGGYVLEPISWNTIVNGDVVVVLLDKLG